MFVELAEIVVGATHIGYRAPTCGRRRQNMNYCGEDCGQDGGYKYKCHDHAPTDEAVRCMCQYRTRTVVQYVGLSPLTGFADWVKHSVKEHVRR